VRGDLLDATDKKQEVDQNLKDIKLLKTTAKLMGTWTEKMEKTEMSRLVMLRPSRTPPVSIFGDVRYQVSMPR